MKYEDFVAIVSDINSYRNILQQSSDRQDAIINVLKQLEIFDND
jgi:hypothetical protein